VLLQLTPAGRRAASRLDRESSLEMERLLAPLPPPDRVELTKCVRRIQEILSAGHRVSTSADVLRATPAKAAEAGMLLNEYYREIGVVQKDTPQSIHSFLTDADSALWIAYMNGVPAGCVVLRPLPKFRAAGECKRLYVRARFRGQGIADTLMEALEQGAKKSSLSAIYLDSKDDLKAALAIYKRRGYKPCKRYNDNPQATVFLKKSLQRED
jgi:GNAT superfamily N-acetyltransferase